MTPQLPLEEILRHLAAWLENELHSDPASPQSAAAPPAARFAVELRLGSREAVQELGAAVDRLQSERDRAIEMLETALADKHTLEERLAAAMRSRKWALAARRRLLMRLRAIEAQAAPGEGAGLPAVPHEAATVTDALRAELETERVARAAAEASLAYSEADRQRLERELARAASLQAELEDQLRAARRLNDDLQAELGELWRVLRETHPGEPLSISLSVSEGDRREGVERVQAKILGARELFKRRSGRWPVAI
ncbi:MAG TPA: hypothetical protein VNN10_09920 [Dehalococcoidia bacterium]|nr:hypothetical protein [Dehalococcoidia bacterium]